MNNAWRSTTLSAAPHEWLRAFHAGWVDRQNGGRWPDAWDRASKQAQIGYESGRLHAVNVMAARLPVPVWGGRRSCVGPVNTAITDASARIGDPVPHGEWV